MSTFQYIVVTKKIVTEKNLQIIGIIVNIIGFFLVGLSLQYKLLWLYYVSCSLFCGIGSCCVYRRLVFNNQLWFKRINHANMGSGLFGFCFGIWTVIFFAISVPMTNTFEIHQVIYIYSACFIPLMVFPTFTIVEPPAVELSQQDVLENKPIDSIVILHNSNSSEIILQNEIMINEEESYHTNTSNSEKKQYLIIPNDNNEIERNLDVPESNDRIEEDVENQQTSILTNSSIKIENDDLLIIEAKKLGIVYHCHSYVYDLSANDIYFIPQTWLVTLFFAAILTPGLSLLHYR